MINVFGLSIHLPSVAIGGVLGVAGVLGVNQLRKVIANKKPRSHSAGKKGTVTISKKVFAQMKQKLAA